jgi:hypothetical protein
MFRSWFKVGTVVQQSADVTLPKVKNMSDVAGLQEWNSDLPDN